MYEIATAYYVKICFTKYFSHKILINFLILFMKKLFVN